MDEKQWRRRFAKELVDRMVEKGMTQADLSRATGLSQVTIHRYAYCDRTANAYDILKIAKALDCTVSELIEFDEIDITEKGEEK